VAAIVPPKFLSKGIKSYIGAQRLIERHENSSVFALICETWGCHLSDCPLESRTSDGRPMPHTLASGKICYLEMPAADIARSSAFYQRVFGWNIRKRGDGSTAFDDPTGEVSGAWVLGRAPSVTPGLLFYINVDSVAAILETIVSNGGEIVQPLGADAPEITARFRDPAGNVIGLYQQPA
jgi:uncharacterized protein